MKCQNCGIELELKQGFKLKKFCGDKCRMAFNRKEKANVENKPENEALKNAPELIKSDENEQMVCSDTPKANNNDEQITKTNNESEQADNLWITSGNQPTLEQIKAMTHAQTISLLEDWRAGKGNAYQCNIANTAKFYREYV